MKWHAKDLSHHLPGRTGWIVAAWAAGLLACGGCGGEPGNGNDNQNNNQGPGCGNGVVEDGEACDGSDLAGWSCVLLGYTGGDLGCDATCSFDLAGCDAPADCGNGVVDPGEDCDGPNLGGADCATLGLEGGSLSCTPSCGFDVTECELQPQCGDGVVQYGEVCDDGNMESGDGCRADCLSDETCGNATTDPAAGEGCDDGNLIDCDGCSATCQLEVCGNGLTECAEVCDDGNLVSGDGCSADCLSVETCGNGVVDSAAGEVCDDGNQVGGDGCAADCRSNETCGNGVVDTAAGEVCDDGNQVGGDGCAADCRSDETCGNAVVDSLAGETCDDGNLTGCDGCSATCQVEVCGNNVMECSEVCDDGNQVGGDGCAANCLSNETCGNGVLDALVGETCDDGGTAPCDGCLATCQLEVCGNNVQECSEVCDDGNLVGGDGCAANCLSNETCGNGVLDALAGETCDDGGTAPCDGCSATCQVEVCGNHVVECSEVCDDGNLVSGDGCAANCMSDETCGNSIVDTAAGEVCDDGGQVAGDGCSADCLSDETCGNSIVDAVTGEVCDDGVDNGHYAQCLTDCSGYGPLCGDPLAGGWYVSAVDDSANDTGVGAGIGISGDGFPVMTYQDDTTGEAIVAKCDDVICSAPGLTFTTLGPGTWPALAVDWSGLPVVVMNDTAVGDLVVIRCATQDCSAVASSTRQWNGTVYDSINAIVHNDGYPFAQMRLASGHLYSKYCTTAACTTGGAGLLTWKDIGPPRSVDLTMGSDDLPVIAAHNVEDSRLDVFKCNHYNCTFQTDRPVFSFISGTLSPAIAVGDSGYPMVAFQRSGAVNLKRCTDLSCSATAPTNILTALGTVGGHLDLAVQNGLPVISYYDSATSRLGVVRCTDVDCTSPPLVEVVDATPGAGTWNRVVVDADGVIHIAYRNEVTGDMLHACQGP